MKKYFIISFLFILINSCSVKIEIDPEELEKDPVVVNVEISEDLLSIDNIDVDVFFFNSYKNNGFIGLRDNKEIDIPLKFTTNFIIDERTYGYSNTIEKVVQLNEKYDLLLGSVTKFLNPQEIVKNDTVYKIQSFNKKSKGKYLLFNKEHYEFIELENGFDIYNLYNLKRQLIDDKLFYINSSSGVSEIKYIDLKDPQLIPQLYHSDSHIVKFLFNGTGNLFYGGIPHSSNRYLNVASQNMMSVSGLDHGLISHFIGLDGEFYAQSFFGNLEQMRHEFYKIEVEADKLITTKLFTFDRTLYPDYYFLGNADIVMPNAKRNSSTIISTNTGSGTMYFYEFNYSNNTITPFDLPIVSLMDIYYYHNDFFMFTELIGNGYTNLIKVDFSNYNVTFKKSLGYLGKEVFFDKKNGDVYFFELLSGHTRFSKLNLSNEISSFDFSQDFGAFFSIINN